MHFKNLYLHVWRHAIVLRGKYQENKEEKNDYKLNVFVPFYVAASFDRNAHYNQKSLENLKQQKKKKTRKHLCL